MCWAGVDKVISRKRWVKGCQPPILAYHRILDIESDELHSGDPDLVSAGCAAFDAQIKFIKEHYTPITFEMFKQIEVSSEGAPSNPIIITFDDGFADNYFNAYPILKKYNIPATFFISTGYIDTNKYFWFDGLANFLKHAEGGGYCFGEGMLNVMLSDSSRIDEIGRVIAYLLGCSNELRISLVDEIRQKFVGSMSRVNKLDCAMSSDQIREMSENGMEFGSHSVSHPILNKLSIIDLNKELAESKQFIENITSKECICLSYPNGKIENAGPEVISAAESFGYRYACYYSESVDASNKYSKYTLNRIAVERYIGLSYFKMRLALPSLFVSS